MFMYIPPKIAHLANKCLLNFSQQPINQIITLPIEVLLIDCKKANKKCSMTKELNNKYKSNFTSHKEGLNGQQVAQSTLSGVSSHPL